MANIAIKETRSRDITHFGFDFRLDTPRLERRPICRGLSLCCTTSRHATTVDRHGDRRVWNFRAGNGGFGHFSLSGKSGNCTWQRLWLKHHQHRLDSWSYGADHPIAVHSQVLRKELPLLTAMSILAAWQLWDGKITRFEAFILLGVFAGLMTWTVWQGMRKKNDTLGREMEQELDIHTMPLPRSVLWLVVGLVLLIISSRILVWGAVEIAHGFGVVI